ncbi:MAG: hypothetical protein PSV22_05895, partial [Pseudolabrys sp.]|nr:hypothetical protein [Pseudolabrys sp.]
MSSAPKICRVKATATWDARIALGQLLCDRDQLEGRDHPEAMESLSLGALESMCAALHLAMNRTTLGEGIDVTIGTSRL